MKTPNYTVGIRPFLYSKRKNTVEIKSSMSFTFHLHHFLIVCICVCVCVCESFKETPKKPNQCVLMVQSTFQAHPFLGKESLCRLLYLGKVGRVSIAAAGLRPT